MSWTLPPGDCRPLDPRPGRQRPPGHVSRERCSRLGGVGATAPASCALFRTVCALDPGCGRIGSLKPALTPALSRREREKGIPPRGMETVHTLLGIWAVLPCQNTKFPVFTRNLTSSMLCRHGVAAIRGCLTECGAVPVCGKIRRTRASGSIAGGRG